MFIWKIKNNIRGPKVIKSANKEHIALEKQTGRCIWSWLQFKTFRRCLNL